jgi:phage terminase large subunit
MNNEISFNPAFFKMFKEPARYFYNIGGRYSGKTHDSIQAILFRLSVVENSRACFMRKVYGSLKDTLFQDVIEISRHIGVEFTKTVSPLRVMFPNGSDIIFKGADDPEKLKGLSSVDIILMDEVNEFSQQDFETIDQSIRGKHQENSIYLCHNPVPRVPGSQYWFETMFRKPGNKGEHIRYYDENLGSYVCSMRTTYQDNKKCPEHVKRRLEGYKVTNPALYKLWAKGEYTEIEGVVFSNWDIVQEIPEGLDDPGYGLDFGFSNDPAACLKIWYNSTNIWIKGIVYSTSLTNQELYDIMKSKEIGEFDEVIADSAEPKSIKDLNNMGLHNIKGAKKRPHYKEDVVQVLQGYAIHLLDGDTDLQREFSTYSWQRDKTGKQLPKLQDGNDHYIDALIMHANKKLLSINELSCF